MPRGLLHGAAMWLVSVLAASGCAQVLGIDGNYVTSPEKPSPSNGGAEATPDAAGTGGSPGGDGGSNAGGATESGGTGNGGTAPAGGAGGASGAGATVNAGCAPGDVTGSFDGFHKPAVTVVGVDASVETSTWAFSLDGGGGTSNISNGHFSAHLKNLVVPDAGSIQGTLDGTLDCKTGKIDGTLTGTVKVLNQIQGSFSGTWTGAVKGQAFAGSWQEIEDLAPSGGGAPGVCVPGSQMGTEPIGTGCGMWSAK